MKKKIIIFCCCFLAFFAVIFFEKNKIFNGFIIKNFGQSAEKSNQTKGKKIYNTINLIDPEGNNIPIFISSLPLFEEYLMEQDDQKIEIERTSVTFLDIKSKDGSFYNLFKYDCGNKLCSSLLVKLSKEKKVISSLKSGYGMFIDVKQSLNLENVVFRFAINEGNLVIRNNLVPFNIKNMELLQVESKQIYQEYIENANIPITDFKWVNNDVILIKVADIQDSTYDSLLNWYKAPIRKTKEIKIELH